MKTRFNKPKTAVSSSTDRDKVEVKSTKPATTIPTLRYDRSTSTNLHAFQKALEIAAGAEFGILFSLSKTGKYPRYERPSKRTVEVERLKELRQAQAIEDPVDQQEAIIGSEGLSSFNERMEVLINALKPLVLLDNQAQRSIFCNEELLEDFTKNETPYIFQGIGGRDKIVNKHHGYFMGHRVDYSPQAKANVLSWTELKDHGAPLDYDGTCFVATLNGQDITFAPHNRLYAARIDLPLVFTTKREASDILEAKELQRRLAFPANSGVLHLLRSGAMSDIPVGTAGASHLDEVVIPNVQGKEFVKKVRFSPPIISGSISDDRRTTLHGDIMYVKPESNKLPFVVTTSDFSLTTVRSLEARGRITIGRAIDDTLTL